jgi:hypothetical protein
MKTFTNTREGNDVITKYYTYKITPTNTVYTALGMRGLGNISESNESSTSNTRVIKDFKMK